jgi:hypothetical protein
MARTRTAEHSLTKLLDLLIKLDRRWIFLAMFVAVIVPILTQTTFPERPTPIVQRVFDKVEELPEGSRVLLAFDYDPASAGELDPMATALVRHCAEKRHRMYFLALWPLGPRMIEDKITNVLRADYPELEYGVHYVNLGFKSGQEGVIQSIVTNLRKYYTADFAGTSLDALPMTRDLRNIQQMDLILSISAGTPGTKEWVQYAATPYRIPIASGLTGVQAPLLYPYYPNQLLGLLGAIKGAAEYEAALGERYPRYRAPELNEGIRRMPPQLFAHLLMVVLIVLGNVVFFARRREGRR